MISGVLTYARARMKSLGFKEHDDAFNPDNIARTERDTTYHLELGEFARDGEKQDNSHILVPFIVRLYKSIERDTNAARDAALVNADNIIDDFTAASNRLNDANIKTCVFDNGTIETLADENDNAMIVKLGFTALVVKSTR